MLYTTISHQLSPSLPFVLFYIFPVPAPASLLYFCSPLSSCPPSFSSSLFPLLSSPISYRYSALSFLLSHLALCDSVFISFYFSDNLPLPPPPFPPHPLCPFYFSYLIHKFLSPISLSLPSLQPLQHYPIHLACARSHGALVAVRLLLNVMGKEGRTVKDKVRAPSLDTANTRPERLGCLYQGD